MRAAPITLADANRFVAVFHRHNGSLPSAKFAIAAIDEYANVRGIAIAGLPKARLSDDGGTLEVNRVCTDGARNACSFLYGSCKRAAKALGYAQLITYTQADEDGASLKASGWTCEGEAGGGSWARQHRPRTSSVGGLKQRWRIVLAAPLPHLIWPPDLLEFEHPTLFAIDAELA